VWTWKVSTFDLIPDLAMAVELTSGYQPTTGPMVRPPN
jgi:hypothetical protein